MEMMGKTNELLSCLEVFLHSCVYEGAGVEEVPDDHADEDKQTCGHQHLTLNGNAGFDACNG